MDRREVPREGVLARVRQPTYTVTSRIIAPMSEVEPATDDPLIANRKTNRENYGQSTRQVQIA